MKILQRDWPPKSEPKFVAIPITVGDFLCMQCTQCTEFSNLSAGLKLTIGKTNQVQQCIANMEGQRRAAKAAARKAEEDRMAAEFKKKMLIIFLIILVFVVISFIIYMYFGDEEVVASKT